MADCLESLSRLRCTRKLRGPDRPTSSRNLGGVASVKPRGSSIGVKGPEAASTLRVVIARSTCTCKKKCKVRDCGGGTDASVSGQESRSERGRERERE